MAGRETRSLQTSSTRELTHAEATRLMVGSFSPTSLQRPPPPPPALSAPGMALTPGQCYIALRMSCLYRAVAIHRGHFTTTSRARGDVARRTIQGPFGCPDQASGFGFWSGFCDRKPVPVDQPQVSC
jgi:hypothetical protein